MTTPTTNNASPSISIAQIVQDIQTYQGEIANYCTRSAQQLKTAMYQLQLVSQAIATAMPALQHAYEGFAQLVENSLPPPPPPLSQDVSQTAQAPNDAPVSAPESATEATAPNASPAPGNDETATTDNDDANNDPTPSPAADVTPTGAAPTASTNDTQASIQSVAAAIAEASTKLAKSALVRPNSTNWVLVDEAK